MKKKLLFFLFISIFLKTFSQNTNIVTGKIAHAVYQTSVSDATITVFNREISYSKKKLPILGKKNYSDIYTKVQTDKDGIFRITFQCAEKKYFYLKIEKENFETVYKDLLIIDPKITSDNYIFQLQPKILTAEEKEFLNQYKETSFEAKNREKAKDAIEAPLDTSTTKAERTNACTYENIPESVYVQYLHNGYNGSNSNSGFTGYINFDEYISGVVKAEIAGITENSNVLKAQAVAARTYSMKKHLASTAVNIGQAYNDTYDPGSSLASTDTNKEIILYNQEVITAIYGARCNGDYTQSAHHGIWNPQANCATSGNYVPYLISKPCSGHSNCTETNESPCCETDNLNSNESAFIYGHGVGLCQRGIERWGEVFELNYCEMIQKYYHEVCIANTDCSSESSLLDCENAIELNCEEVYHGSSSNKPSLINSYACNNWTETGPERVHQFTAPESGTFTVTISNFTGDLDVYILGSCDPQDCLGEVFSAHSTYTEAIQGKTYYLVVDADDGSSSSYDIEVSCGELSIPELTKQAQLYPNPVKDILYIDSDSKISEIYILNNLGTKVYFSRKTQQSINLSFLPSGIYQLIYLDAKKRKQTHTFIKA